MLRTRRRDGDWMRTRGAVGADADIVVMAAWRLEGCGWRCCAVWHFSWRDIA